MKRLLYILCLAVAFIPAGLAAYYRYFAVREIVIISTNDIHSQIDSFPRLASAVKACRDTVATCLLVDAGDRWTGDAFVDLAPERRKPIIDLMNRLGYDVATFGNHEFDDGAEFLGRMMKNYRFRTVCANIRSTDGRFPDVDPYTIIDVGSLKIGFAGVVTNFQNGHPEGNDSSYAGLEFPDAFEAAENAVRQMKPKCDFSVLISHLGSHFDSVLLNRITDYDLMISGHSHLLLDGEVNGTLLGQTEKRLSAVGVTTIRARGSRILSVDYRNVPLKDYPLDDEYAQLVDEIKASSPELYKKVGYNAVELDKVGLADMHTTTTRDAMDADLGFYHYGGIRLSELPADSVSRGTLINSDIFISHLYTVTMTPAQMRRMIISKYNDSGNLNESRRLDLFSTEPYSLVVDAQNRAVNVIFPTLKEGQKYKVSICNYIVDNYKDIECEDKVYHADITVPEIFIDYFERNSPVTFSNEPRQRIVKQEESN